MSHLTLALKREYFDAIKRGEKLEEYCRAHDAARVAFWRVFGGQS